MASTRGQRLRTARKARFKSARAAALALRIPISTYGAHERAEMPGGRDYGPEEAKTYARRFGVTPEWLLTGRRRASIEARGDSGRDWDETWDEAWTEPEDMEKPARPLIPLVGYIGAGFEAHFYEISPGHMEEMEGPRVINDATHMLQIGDHGLSSTLDGWFLLFDEVRSPVTPDLIGHLCLIGLDDGRIFLRQMRPGKTPGCYDLLSDFGLTFRDVAVSWAAKITTMYPP